MRAGARIAMRGASRRALTAVALLCLPCSAAPLEVVDGGGEPVPGARVVVMRISGDSRLASLLPFQERGVSDEHGRVEVALPGLPGTYIVVDHPGHAPLVVSRGDGAPPRRLTLSAGETWSGRVATSGGDVGSGARICARATLPVGPWEQRFTRCSAVDAAGGFTLTALPPPPFEVSVTAPCCRLATFHVTALSAAALALEPGVPVSGAILDRRGDVLPGAVVETPAGEIAAGPDGSFAFGAASLPVELTVRHEGYRAARIAVASSEPIVAALEPVERMSAELLTEEGRFRGYVEVWIDSPREGGGVWGSSRRIEVEEGRLAIDLPGPGSFSFRLAAPGFQQIRTGPHTVAPDRGLFLGTLVMGRGGGFRGRCSDPSTGEPLAGVLAEALPVGAAVYSAVRGGRSAAAVSDDDGELLLSGLPDGRYVLRIQPPGLAPLFGIYDVVGKIVDLGSLALGEGVGIAGVVRGRSGEPRPGLRVGLYDPAREYLEPLLESSTGADGSFALSRCAPGRYRLEVTGNRTLWAQPLELTGERFVELTVGGARLEGAIVPWEPGQGFGAVLVTSRLDPSRLLPKVSLQTPAGQLSYGFSSFAATGDVKPNGRFVVEDVPAGPLTVHVSGERQAIRLVTLPDCERADVVLDLSGESVSGTVVDRHGVPLPATASILAEAGVALATCRTDDGGWFRAAGLPAGQWRVVVLAEGFVPRSMPVTLPLEEPLPPFVLDEGEAGWIRVRLQRADGDALGGAPAILVGEGPVDVQARIALGGGELEFGPVAAGRYALLWADPLAGSGAAPGIDLAPGERRLLAPDLGIGSSVTLVCPSVRCGGGAVEGLVVAHESGADLTPLLSAASLGLRVGEAGELPLGRLAAGRYIFRLAVAGERWEQTSDVVAGEPTRIDFF